MAFFPFEGGRGDETFVQHPKPFIPLTPFKGGKCFASLCYGPKELLRNFATSQPRNFATPQLRNFLCY